MVVKIQEGIEYRTCTQCKEKMTDGFVVERMHTEYYCTDTCLDKNLSTSEYNEMYEQDLAYWTEF